LINLLGKLINYIGKFESNDQINTNQKYVIHSFNIINLLVENCISTLHSKFSIITNLLIKFENISNNDIRFQMGKCWLTLIKYDEKLLETHFDKIFEIFIKNLNEKHYDMNFNACEFLLSLFDEDTNDISNRQYYNYINKNLSQIVLKIYEYIILTNNDLCSIELGENISKKDEKQENDEDDDTTADDNEGYNVNWTLRKCGSKLLDKLSYAYKDSLINILRKGLEEGMQSKNWKIKY